MIKTIVFDVGDVLIRFRYRDHMRDLGFSDEAVEELSNRMVLTVFWSEMDRGAKMEADAVEHFTARMPEYAEEIRTFWAHTEGLVREFPYAEGLVKGLKDAGYGVYVLSNYPEETAKRHWPVFRFLPHADGYIISAYEKLVKPDPRLYRLLESRFGVNLSECLFIDDRQVNVDGAEAVGMQGLLFRGYEELLKDLEKLGIRPVLPSA